MTLVHLDVACRTGEKLGIETNEPNFLIAVLKTVTGDYSPADLYAYVKLLDPELLDSARWFVKACLGVTA